MNVNEILKCKTEKWLRDYWGSTVIPTGMNGPYCNPETEIRMTCHWLILCCDYFSNQIKEDIVCRERVRQTIEELSIKLSNEITNTNGSLTQTNSNRIAIDYSNGVIGDAWVIEALCKAYSLINNPYLLEAAIELLKRHKFNSRHSLWHRVSTNGDKLRIDQTFNHQLWFCAAASEVLLVSNDPEVRKQVDSFLIQIERNIMLLGDGLIYHPISRKCDFRSHMSIFFREFYSNIRLAADSRVAFKNVHSNYSMINKSIGYQTFCLYAFSILKENLPKHDFWKSNIYSKIIKYSFSEDFLSQLHYEKNYGYSYNVSGFELAYAFYVNKDMLRLENNDFIYSYIKKQLDHNYNLRNFEVKSHIKDPVTADARLYELTRIPYEVREELTCQK